MGILPVSANAQWASAKPARVFIGHDEREQRALEVCRHSLRTRSTMPLDIQALDQSALRLAGLYRRAPMPGTWQDDQDKKPFSTAFTFTRFLVPALCQWSGWALFADCDFLFGADLADLWALRDDRYAVMVVKHKHEPPETTKMDGREQTRYWRKNWSSLILWNCGHPANRVLTPDMVSQKPGSWLHGFEWLNEYSYKPLIGPLPHGWNWLEDGACEECRALSFAGVHAIHYTRGGPWFDNHQNVQHADLWLTEERALGSVS